MGKKYSCQVVLENVEAEVQERQVLICSSSKERTCLNLLLFNTAEPCMMRAQRGKEI